jgi:hypothetical protein
MARAFSANYIPAIRCNLPMKNREDLHCYRGYLGFHYLKINFQPQLPKYRDGWQNNMNSPLTTRLRKQLTMLRQFASSGHRTPIKTILL